MKVKEADLFGFLKFHVNKIVPFISYFNLDAKLLKKLGHLQVQLIGVGGADGGTYERHGYAEAMRTQIDHGIFDYCGARVVGPGCYVASLYQRLCM